MNKNQKLFFLILMSLMMVVLNADSEVMTPTLGIIEKLHISLKKIAEDMKATARA
ncbi:MAG TPA: hypothetical protein PLG43_14935 [Spirochaetia bacterium]|nr:hypothetical protein [Spirochaetia bacterium]